MSHGPASCRPPWEPRPRLQRDTAPTRSPTVAHAAVVVVNQPFNRLPPPLPKVMAVPFHCTIGRLEWGSGRWKPQPPVPSPPPGGRGVLVSLAGAKTDRISPPLVPCSRCSVVLGTSQRNCGLLRSCWHQLCPDLPPKSANQPKREARCCPPIPSCHRRSRSSAVMHVTPELKVLGSNPGGGQTHCPRR